MQKFKTHHVSKMWNFRLKWSEIKLNRMDGFSVRQRLWWARPFKGHKTFLSSISQDNKSFPPFGKPGPPFGQPGPPAFWVRTHATVVWQNGRPREVSEIGYRNAVESKKGERGAKYRAGVISFHRVTLHDMKYLIISFSSQHVESFDHKNIKFLN